MEKEYRAELDKFQILSQQLADAIYMYFAGGYSSTTLHIVHACNMLKRDIYNHYLKKGDIEEMVFWSEKVDRLSDVKLFNFKRENGEQGLYIHKGNFVKHGNKDTEDLVLVSDQTAFEYLYATVKDYRMLQKQLLKAGLLHLYEGHLYAQKRGRVATALARTFLKTAYKMGIVNRHAPFGKVTHVDYLCGVFLEWQDAIEKFVGDKAPRLQQSFHEASTTSMLSKAQRRDLSQRFFGALGRGIDVLTPYLKMKLRIGSPKDYIRACYDNGNFLRETLRRETKGAILSFISKYSDKHSFDQAGYYLNVDHRVATSYDYAKDSGGIDFIKQVSP